MPRFVSSRRQVAAQLLGHPGSAQEAITEEYVVAAVSGEQNGSVTFDRSGDPQHRLRRGTTEGFTEGARELVQREIRVRHPHNFVGHTERLRSHGRRYTLVGWIV